MTKLFSFYSKKAHIYIQDSMENNYKVKVGIRKDLISKTLYT